jgi:potassium efflux system protein
MRECSCILLAVLLATEVAAQEPKLEVPAPAPGAAAAPAPAAATEPAAAEWIRPEAVPGRADALVSQLESAGPESATQEKLEGIEGHLAGLEPKLDALSARIDDAFASSADLAQLEDLRRELAAAAAPLSTWHTALEAESLRASDGLEQLGDAQALWSATLGRPETVDAGPAVARRVAVSLQLISESATSLRAWRDRVVDLDDRVLERRTAVTSTITRLEEAAEAQRTSLFVPDRGPIWRTGYLDALRAELPRVREELGQFIGQNRGYLASDPRPFAAQVLIAGLLAVALLRAAPIARQRSTAAPDLADATRMLERPIAIAVLLALMLTPWIQPLAPRRFTQLLALIALIAVARVLSHTTPDAGRVALASLFGLLLLDRFALALEELPAISQTLFLLEMVLGFAIAVRVARRGGVLGRGRLWVTRAAEALAVAVAFAFVAELSGWSRLALLLGRGAVVAALTAVYVWAAVGALDAVLVWTLHSPRWSRLLRGGRVARRIARWLGVSVWVYLLVNSIGQRDLTAETLRRFLDLGVSVGALSLTIGGVLAFVLTVAAAPFIARAIIVVLEEGVYPRAHLSRGVPYALSTMVRYTVYSFAFIAALAAAGVQLGQLSILLGGLGVGVGLGLQDFVKNFAAGLTLLVERRVHVGDVVRIPAREVDGRVLQIGMRAVVVRNWDGAEVIVPNMDLISGAVTNWTLSDKMRRFEVPVGVAYGTDPERVIALLLEVARSHEDVLDHPAPQALFQGFGESALNFVLRIWTDREYDRTTPIRSDLSLATHRALRDAGIEVPFPQRDLHLTMSPPVRALLGGEDSGDPA